MNLAANKHCPIKDARSLMYDYTLSEVSEWMEYVEIQEAMEIASHLDEQERIEKLKHK